MSKLLFGLMMSSTRATTPTASVPFSSSVLDFQARVHLHINQGFRQQQLQRNRRERACPFLCESIALAQPLLTKRYPHILAREAEETRV